MNKKQLENISRHFYLILIVFFLVAPIIYLIIFSFNSTSSMNTFVSFGVDKYFELFANDDFVEAVFVTLSIAIIATIVSIIIGTIAAIALVKMKRGLKESIIYLTNIPIMNPEIVTAVALMIFFLSTSIGVGYFPMLLAHIAFCTPYVIITLYPRIKKLDPHCLEAALDLGATPNQALRKVILPQLRGAIIAAFSIAFTMSFDDFVISYFTGGNVENISTFIYSTKKPVEILPEALSFTTILTVSIILIFVIRHIIYVIKNRNEENEDK